jgi:large subunit ribosomal protein L29
MKMADVKSLIDDELVQKEKDCREELFNLKFQHAIGKLENTSRLRVLKRDVARIRTEQKLRTFKEGSV